ncbi:hypothetical protein QQ045_014420 [Rhodiola kirilowii]
MVDKSNHLKVRISDLKRRAREKSKALMVVDSIRGYESSTEGGSDISLFEGGSAVAAMRLCYWNCRDMGHPGSS